MRLRVKGTKIELTPELKRQIRQKIVRPLQHVYISDTAAVTMDVELERTTKHHQKGRIWKCEATITLPKTPQPLRAEAVAETISAAIDIVKDRLERVVKKASEKGHAQQHTNIRKLRRSLVQKK
ncbi:MAG: ribosome-associated translation inhibitor RaiA [Parcubacteria group bacterium]|nr:ribosome-associated translation inhibitor RaiA [Parcubacteria group bacterium]